MPSNASSATQADAFVSLLDYLGLDKVDVIGISAGTGAALQLAVRHPDRVGHLVISSGNLPGSPTATAPPGWAKVFYNDVAMWMLKTVSRQTVDEKWLNHIFTQNNNNVGRPETYELGPEIKWLELPVTRYRLASQ